MDVTTFRVNSTGSNPDVWQFPLLIILQSKIATVTTLGIPSINEKYARRIYYARTRAFSLFRIIGVKDYDY